MEGSRHLGVRNEAKRGLGREDICELAKKNGYKAVDAFSGPGGMSLGLQQAGLRMAFAFDNNDRAVSTYCANLGEHCVVGDARELTGEQIIQAAEIQAGDLALLAGGPPCQGFSKQKRGAHLGDDRNDLILEYLRLISEVRPRFFILENVKIFGQKRGRMYLEEMHRQLDEYDIRPEFYNSANFGLAQTRERFVAVGSRKDQAAWFNKPAATVTTWKTVGDVLSGLPEPPEDYSDHPEYPNHQRARVTEINIKRFSHVPQGGGWQEIPYDLRLDCHKKSDVTAGGWPDVYGRLSWDGQCPTITGGFDSFTRGRYGHPLEDRPITPREAARIQGFPDEYVFHGTRGDIRSQIGNAVPPPLAKAIGLEIARCLLCSDGVIEDTAPSGAGQLGLFKGA